MPGSGSICFFFFLKNAVLGLGLRLVSTPRFIDGRDNIDLEGNFEKKKKIRLKSFEIVTTFRYKRRIIKLFYIKKTHGISFRFHSRSDEDTKHIFRWCKGLSKVNIEKLFIFENIKSNELILVFSKIVFKRRCCDKVWGISIFPSCSPIHGIYRKSLEII